MYYLDSNGNIAVGENPGEGWTQVVAPKSSYYKLKANWKDSIPDVWEFNPFKVSLQLKMIVDKVVRDKLIESYNKYITEIIDFKTQAQKDIESIQSEEDAQLVILKIQRIADNISMGPVDPSLYK